MGDSERKSVQTMSYRARMKISSMQATLKALGLRSGRTVRTSVVELPHRRGDLMRAAMRERWGGYEQQG